MKKATILLIALMVISVGFLSGCNEKKETEDFKVADLSLAEWGRKEILLAEKEMPGLVALRKKYKNEKTFYL